MAEPTTPATGVTQEPPSVETRMQNFLVQYDKEQSAPPESPEEPTPAPAQEAQQPDGQADELTADDIPDVAADAPAQPAVDEFEIVHNGQQQKLSRAETIRLAQQGFDYTQKTQALAEQSKAMQAALQRAQQIEQMQAALAPDLAAVKLAEQQLQQYQNVNWVQLARDNPLEYPVHKAQHDILKDAYQRAVGEAQNKAGFIQQQRQALTAQVLQQQRAQMLEKIPAWRDNAKFEQGATEVRDYLLREGLDPTQVEQLSDAKAVVIAYKAAQYDKLLRAKTDKVKQLKGVPPVTRPGASQGNQDGADRRAKLQTRLAKSGDIRDAAALLLDRMK